MFSPLERAIVKTLAYADVFDYPLTMGEVRNRLIGFTIHDSRFTIHDSKLIKEKNGYYFLPGRGQIVDTRKKRKQWSDEKIKIAKKIANILARVPTIQLIGISGALASNNTEKADDIDLFIITSNGWVWTTRFIVSTLVEFVGKRRHPSDKESADKICLNMFVDEDHMAIPKNEQNLYSAYEVLLMKPLFTRNNVYQRFLSSNKWVEKYLPNGIRFTIQDARFTNKKAKFPLLLIEKLLHAIQVWYMQRRRTTEVVEKGRIKFHPQDARNWVLRKYEKLCRMYQLF